MTNSQAGSWPRWGGTLLRAWEDRGKSEASAQLELHFLGQTRIEVYEDMSSNFKKMKT